MDASARPADDEPRTRVIRRYANRKLYDCASSGFTSLRAIEQLVRDGEDVQVVDHATGVDLTQRVLGRVLGDSTSSELPMSTLIRMPGRVALAIVQDDDDARQARSGELQDLREQVEELTRMVSVLLVGDRGEE